MASKILANLLALIAILAACILANVLTRFILVNLLTAFSKKSKNKFDDALIEFKVFHKLSHLAPALVLFFSSAAFPNFQVVLERLSMAYIVFTGLSVLLALLDALGHFYQSFEVSQAKPIRGYLQIAKVLFVCITLIFIIASLMNRSPWGILSGLGAMSAILLLVFKDTILGLVASFQISANHMLQVGDWIEMPKYGADGDVIDISLATVKVRNWDKTITTLPTYSLISDAFKNWRGMSESGGRRIKRAIHIDINTIAFLKEDQIARLQKIQHLDKYLSQKQKEIADHNDSNHIDASSLANGRHLTNVGTFRAYIREYLKSLPYIHQEMTFLIRQLQPTDVGLPIEVYVFSNDQDWVRYEGIQSDIFDHLFAILPEFNLSAFQRPSGLDFRGLKLTA